MAQTRSSRHRAVYHTTPHAGKELAVKILQCGIRSRDHLLVWRIIMMVVDVVVALAMSENCVGCFTACVTPGDAGTASLLVFHEN